MAGCGTNPPRQNVPAIDIPQWQWNCGKPSASLTIDANGSRITDIRINWGRTRSPQQPQVYALESLESDWPDHLYSLRRSDGQSVTLPSGGVIETDFRFDFRERMRAGETLSLIVFVLYDDGTAVRTSSARAPNLVHADQGFSGCVLGGGNEFNGDGIGDDGSAAGVCPDDANLTTGGLAAPTLDPDPGAAQGPLPGAACAGAAYSPASNETVVAFDWNKVTGVASGNKAYQVEIVNRDSGAGVATTCVGDWRADGGGIDNGSKNDCVIADTDTESFSRLLNGNSDYAWRARATCKAMDGTRRIGPFTPRFDFRTKGQPGKIELVSPAANRTVRVQGEATTVVFRWKALPCGVTKYHLIIIGDADLPDDGEPLNPEQRPTSITAEGVGRSMVVGGENLIELTARIPNDDTYRWWVYADTPLGATPPLMNGDGRTLSLSSD